MAISERLQQRISNLTQGMGEINPPSRRMSNEEVQTAKKNNPDPMAFAMGSADGSGFYTDQPQEFSNEEKVQNTLKQLAMNAQTPEELERLLPMINPTGAAMPMMSAGDETAQAIEALTMELQKTQDPENPYFYFPLSWKSFE